MRIIANVKIINVIELNQPHPPRWTIETDLELNQPHPPRWTIETNHIEVPAFNATSPEHHELVKMFFDSDLADSYSILINEKNHIIGITPSGSKVETQWRESFSIKP